MRSFCHSYFFHSALSTLILMVLFFSQNIVAQEIINNYSSDIIINADSSLTVTETITVKAENSKIKRGIYRDFPTRYKDTYGNNYVVNFKLLSVLRNGQIEDYHTKAISNGIRIYIGNKDRFLQVGEHTFTIEYMTHRQLGFFDNYDEIYWNVTGNGWEFPIKRASAIIHLPPGVDKSQTELDAYTGAMGDKGKNVEQLTSDDNSIVFSTIDQLPRAHGLTVVVSWPKGYVQQPSREQKIHWFFQDNAAVLVGTIGLIILNLYFYIAWRKVGRDPQKGVIFPQYEPDKEHSPASMRFLSRMAYDNKAFSAALVNMAVKAYITISNDRTTDFLLKKTSTKKQAKNTLSLGEAAIYRVFFQHKKKILLNNKEHILIKKALKAHKRVLKRDYEKIYFLTNRKLLIPGWIISIISLILTFLAIDSLDTKNIIAFFVLWLSIWTIGVSFLSVSAYIAWKNVRSIWGVFPALFITLFAVPFFISEIAGLYLLWENVGTGLLLVFVMLISSNVFFYQWMKAPTLRGRKLLDKVDGFKLYLNVAEADELKFHNAPELTPELFEQFLPYAIALDVETKWATRFNHVFSQLKEQGHQHSPSWYRGNHWNSSKLSSFSGVMANALSSAISSSATAPGSSGGGGGFSGGGGGGGGGGGW